MIEIQSLHHVTNQGVSLNIESFQVDAGEITAIIGVEGSGIETILALLTGKASPEQGQVRIARLDPRQDQIGFSQHTGVLYLEDGLYKNQTVEENLLFECRLRNLPKSHALEVLGWVGLSDQLRTRLNQLKPSLQRRLAFSRAILHNPSELLLYEPFVRCDEASIEIISQLLHQIAPLSTAVLVFSSGSMHLTNLCEKIFTLQQGHLVESEKLASPDQGGQPFKIPVKLEDRVALLNPGDILYAEAAGDTAHIQTLTERLPTRYTLSELETRLKRSGFFRAHRAYLVNLQHVSEVIPFTRNSFSLRLDDPGGTILPLSKSAASELKALLDF
jgi:ABC-2 type transport system ATP-binding protein